MNHWQLTRDDGGIAWLVFDQVDSPVNTLSADTLAGFSGALAEIEGAPPRGLVILSGKRSGFIAGADVKRFAGMRDPHVAETLIRDAHALLFRLEKLPCPSVAAIHGFCLGGGLELALACTYRIATDDIKTVLGFPEIRLGIFPGFGGSVRSIARVGHLAAMQMMLSGRNLSGPAAKKIGLVDDCVPRRQLEAAAAQVLKHAPRHRRPALIRHAAGWPGIRALVAERMKKQAAAHANPVHYPAPDALIEHWRRHAGNPAAMYDGEAREVSRLLTGDTAQNLVRVFLLQEQLKSRGGETAFIPRHLHVVGAGVMGGDIAAWGVLQGMTVSLQDRGNAQLARAMGRARELFTKKLKQPRLITGALDRLIPDVDGSGIAKADVVIEAIVEDVTAKRSLFEQLVPRMKPGALLATNTSSIPLEILGETLPHPERLVGLHFFNPVAKMPLLEIVRGSNTDPAAVAQALAFARHFNKLPLIVASSPGFLVNRILMPYLIEAVTLVEEGVPPQVVDHAATAFGMPMGPVELADTVGLDICLSVAGKMAGLLRNAVPVSLKTHVEAGHLGRKSGQGYYRWENGKPARGAAAAFTVEQQDRLMLRLLNEAVACLREGVVADADALDAGVIFGTGFAPFTGGPMHYIRATGAASLHARLASLHTQFGERFTPDPGWAALRKKGSVPFSQEMTSSSNSVDREKGTDPFFPIKVEPGDTLDGVFRKRVALTPDALAYRHFDATREAWLDTTWAGIAREAARWQAALATLGLERGERVAIMLRNCREWIAFDQAALGLGLVSVPLYTSDRADNTAWVLKDAGCRVLLIEGAETWQTLQPVRDGIAALDALIALEPLPDAPANLRLASAWLPTDGGTLVEGRTRADDPATLAYTSGTTGRPKGVMLSHRNILFNVQAGLEAVDACADDLMLSFLPLSHMLERSIGEYLPMVAGIGVAFARSIPLLSEDLHAVQPTLLITVPRIFERMHDRIRETLDASSPVRQKLVARAVELGWLAFLHRQGRAPWSPGLILQPALDRLVGAKIRGKLGGRLRFAICGGAPLPADIGRFFIALGVNVLQGYGLTETGPVISVNRLQDNEPASVGPALPGIEVRIGDNDELLTRSPSVMLGYWNNAEATRNTIDAEGWLHTGDRAAIGPRGHITITGRLKEILVLSTGEKVSPADIEQALAACPLLEQAMVVGDGRPFLTALVVPRDDALKAAAAKLGIAPDSEAMRQHILEQLLPRLHDFPGYARLGGVALIRENFSVENGLLTPTLKLKRGEVLRRYRDEVDELYAGH